MKSLKPEIAIIDACYAGSTFPFVLIASFLAREIIIFDKYKMLSKTGDMNLNYGLCPVNNTY